MPTRLCGTTPDLVLVHFIYGFSFTTLFFRNICVSVPEDLIKSALIDGAEFWLIFTRSLLPLSWPIVIVAVIWQFSNVWNDFLFGVSFASGTDRPIIGCCQSSRAVADRTIAEAKTRAALRRTETTRSHGASAGKRSQDISFR